MTTDHLADADQPSSAPPPASAASTGSVDAHADATPGDAAAASASTATATASGFAGLRLGSSLLSALATLGYEEPTPVQEAAIPPLLAGRDVLARAATGTGKTAAFALPLLQRLPAERPRGGAPSALVLVPTRELAMQVAEALFRYGREQGTVTLPIYGGAPMNPQRAALARGVHVVVATPGRTLDHLRRGSLALDAVTTLVLDEADEMLDMGFADDLEAILAATPAEKQVALFSATLAPRLLAIARAHLRDPVDVQVEASAAPATDTSGVRQLAYLVSRAHKVAALGRVLDVEAPRSTMVFCRTRTEVDELAETMTARGYRAEALHGGLSQEQRDRVMQKFRGEQSNLLVATDVAARGLDVEHVTHVVNFDVPSASSSYVHRIGRTGRAGRAGTAITLAEPREQRLLRSIEHATGRPITLQPLPSVADVRARQRARVTAAVHEAVRSGALEPWRRMVLELVESAETLDVLDVAAAAVEVAAQALGAATDEQEIPAPPARGAGRAHRAHGEGRHRSGGDREGVGSRPGGRSGGRAAARYGARHTDVTTLFVGAGRTSKLRPGDLVGAITGETGLPADAIGAIRIGDRHATVEVPTDRAGEVVDALNATKIKGKRIRVRLDRAAGGGRRH
jgi:ATP-dependent RNA helicase DeaD